MKQQHQQNNHEHQGRNRQKQTTKQNPSALARFAAPFNRHYLANILVCEGDSEGEIKQPRIIASEGGMQGESKRGSAQDANTKRKPKVSTPARLLLTSARPIPSQFNRKKNKNQTFTYQRMHYPPWRPTNKTRKPSLSTNATASSSPFGHRCWVAVVLVSHALRSVSLISDL